MSLSITHILKSFVLLIAVCSFCFSSRVFAGPMVFCGFTVSGDAPWSFNETKYFGFVHWAVDTSVQKDLSPVIRLYSEVSGNATLFTIDGENRVNADISQIIVVNDVNGTSDVVQAYFSNFSGPTIPQNTLNLMRFWKLDTTVLASKDLPADIATYELLEKKFFDIDMVDETGMPYPATASIDSIAGSCMNP